jgi:aminotransferase
VLIVKTKFTIQSAKRMQELPKQFFASLVGKVTEKVNQGYDVINLGQGNPDQPTPTHIVEALQKSSADPKYHGYSPFQGHQFLKEAIAQYYKREYNVDINPDTEVAILFGGKSGLIEVSQCLLNPGDLCLVPDPGYPDYWSGISLAQANMEFMPLLEENQFLPDYKQISRSSLDQAKMMFLNYPNNPTAAVATEEFFKETVDVAYDHQVAVVHDFAYGAIGFDGQKPVSFLQTPGAKDVGIEIFTMSKTYNMAGWRVGFALGNPEIIRLINLLQDHQFVSLFGGIQAASAFALNESQESVKQLVQLYEKRRDYLFNQLEQLGWKASKPKGSFFSWLPVPEGFTSVSFADLLLEEAQIVVAPGIGFGQYGDPYVRVGLLTSEERFSEAIHRIKKLNLF